MCTLVPFLTPLYKARPWYHRKATYNMYTGSTDVQTLYEATIVYRDHIMYTNYHASKMYIPQATIMYTSHIMYTKYMHVQCA